MIVLGAEVDGRMNAIPGTGFNGVVSKVNMWNRVLNFAFEIPAMADDYRALVDDGLIRRWDNYLVMSGSTVTRPSRANSVVCEDEGFTGPACNIPVPGTLLLLLGWRCSCCCCCWGWRCCCCCCWGGGGGGNVVVDDDFDVVNVVVVMEVCR